MASIKRIILLLFIQICLLTTSALAFDLQKYEGVYSIVEDKVVVDEKLTFSTMVDSFKLFIPSDATALEVNGAEIVVQERPEFKELTLHGNYLHDVSIKYITESLIERNKDSFFILDLGELDASMISVQVILPEKSTLKHSLNSLTPSIIPKTEKVTTDGKSIIVEWEKDDFQRSKAILIIYEEATKNSSKYWFFLLIIIVVSFILYIILRRSSDKIEQKKFSENEDNIHEKKAKLTDDSSKKSEDIGVQQVSKEIIRDNLKEKLTRNLFEEERAIVEILLEKGELWQKQLTLVTGISKVKLSRKLKKD
ncbi:hypothetical protein HYT52_01845 [Candidatus Woesearchaeota archaeon]|nr:hypothetical protein [Candidatus Woesearchaeota archaeon]